MEPKSILNEWKSLSPKRKQELLQAWNANVTDSTSFLKEELIAQAMIGSPEEKFQLAMNCIEMLIALCLSKKEAKCEISQKIKEVHALDEILNKQEEMSRENEYLAKQLSHYKDVQIEALFFPNEASRYCVMKQLMKAKCEVKVAMYYFTDQFFLNALKNLSRRDVEVKLIYTEMKGLEVKTTGTRLKVKQISLRKVTKQYSNFMHHKFVVIDQDTVLTGSLNWTKMQHNENVVIIRQAESIAKAFSTQFDKLFE